jgi:hypothetical protein
MPPFLMGYQLDYALFSKSGRVSQEANHILQADGPHHWFGNSWLPVSDDRELWFNQPLKLPQAMEKVYQKMKHDADKERALTGLKPEKDWARFSNT